MSNERCEWNVEGLSARLHAIYQEEARRQAGSGEDTVRHPDDYDALPEHTKEYDRVLARFIILREERLADRVRTLEEVLQGVRDDPWSEINSDTVETIDHVLGMLTPENEDSHEEP